MGVKWETKKVKKTEQKPEAAISIGSIKLNQEGVRLLGSKFLQEVAIGYDEKADVIIVAPSQMIRQTGKTGKEKNITLHKARETNTGITIGCRSFMPEILKALDIEMGGKPNKKYAVERVGISLSVKLAD